jgi:hypothetical protein
LVGADILVTGKVEVMIRDILKEEPKNGKMSRHLQLEANMTLSGAAARIGVCQCQLLTKSKR